MQVRSHSINSQTCLQPSALTDVRRMRTCAYVAAVVLSLSLQEAMVKAAVLITRSDPSQFLKGKFVYEILQTEDPKMQQHLFYAWQKQRK